MTERDLTRAVNRLMKARRDCWFFKVAGGPFQRPGVPDFIGCVRGRFVAIELKTPDGKLTRHQKQCLAEIRGAFGLALVCRSLQEVEKALNRSGSKGQISLFEDTG